MKKWIVKKNSTSLDSLQLVEAPIPQPLRGEVRIKNYAVSLNYRDIVVTKGTKGMGIMRDAIPCSDGAGIVDAVGEGVTQWKLGDRVITQCYGGWDDNKIPDSLDLGLGSNDADGTLAEYFVVKANQLIAAPATQTFAQASTLPCAGITAWSAINGNRPYIFPLQKNEKVLVLGTGGVSMMAISIAIATGAEVYCTTGQDDKIDVLKKMGVKEVVNYKTDLKWGETIFEKTQGVDLVVNNVGLAAIDQSVNALNFGGRMSMVGAIDDASATFTQSLQMMRKNNIFFGVLTGSTKAFADYIRFIDENEIKPYISKTFSFDKAKEAFEAASSSGTFGKIVIEIMHS